MSALAFDLRNQIVAAINAAQAEGAFDLPFTVAAEAADVYVDPLDSPPGLAVSVVAQGDVDEVSDLSGGTAHSIVIGVDVSRKLERDEGVEVMAGLVEKIKDEVAARVPAQGSNVILVGRATNPLYDHDMLQVHRKFYSGIDFTFRVLE
jgi:hypothetical protein